MASCAPACAFTGSASRLPSSVCSRKPNQRKVASYWVISRAEFHVSHVSRVTGSVLLPKEGKMKLMRTEAEATFWFAANCVMVYGPTGSPMIDWDDEGVKRPKMYSVFSSRPSKVRESETRPWTWDKR
jgi:hypothetical protein